MTADGKHRHETISDATIAEMEAGIYGLQVENYYLDGFMHDLISHTSISISLVLDLLFFFRFLY